MPSISAGPPRAPNACGIIVENSEVLPEFTLADPDAAAEIRVRHLLTHTSGIDGDVFLDTGDGDDCVEKYVKELRTAVSVTVPGGPLSYCNAGFVVAGRMVEVLRGNVWDDVLVERIYQPLGLDHVITRAKDAPLFRTAVGHVKIGAGTDEVIPVTTWMLPRSMGPAGLITGSAESLLTFGAAHLRDGLGLTGERIVSAESARLMRTLHTSLSAVSSTQQGWGLGWNLEQWGAETSVSHLGGTIGQVASLHTFHEQQVAIVSLANSRGGDGFNRQMRTLVGTYDSTLTRWQITQDADRRLWIGMTSKNTVLGEPDPEPQLMKPAGRDRFLATVDGAEMEFAYLEYAGKHYLYNLRLYERADASA